MAFLTPNDLIAAMEAGNVQRYVEKDTVSASVSHPVSLWTVGPFPVAGATPTTAAVCTGALAGAVAFPNATRGTRRLIGMRSYSLDPNASYALRDRLAHMGGLSGASTSAQTVDVDASDIALTDRIGASDFSEVDWFLEWYVATGVTSRTATVTYTNHAGTSGRTVTVTVPASAAARRFIPILPTNGDYIKSVQTVQLNSSTGTAGDFGVTATRIIHEFKTRSDSTYSSYIVRDEMDETVQAKLHDDGCFFFSTHFSSGTATSELRCRIQTIDG